ncbi:MAG TPA: N-acetylmuramoyl-L-alanine amidase [Terriglobales bacterium]|nr:N-acetylmuramoyl-L-alanine amidase [Terriglobales bacterium]
MCLAAALAALLVCLPAEGKNPRRGRQLAQSQFETAQRMREALNGRPVKERAQGQYARVIEAYGRVYHYSPASPHANESLLAMAELLAEEGRVLGKDAYFEKAIDQYRFLRREYPGSSHRFEALFTIGQIYWEDLEQPQQATATFQEFLKSYPNHRLAEQAKQALAEIQKQARVFKKAPAAAKQEKKNEHKDKQELKAVAEDTGSPQPEPRSGRPLVTSIRHWSTPDYTRVAIDLENEVQYEAGRIADPDRIFFDLHDTKLASELVGKTFDVEDGFLKRIRVAQYQRGMTRVVLEVQDLAEYSAFLLPNPYRLIVDIHGKAPVKTETAAKEKDKPAPAVAKPEAATKPESSKTSKTEAAPSKAEIAKKAEAERPEPAPGTEREVKATSKPTSGPTYEAVAPRGEGQRKSAPPSLGREARPTASGEHSLVRALGLKIGRIVIDPGHGGHDTGTIGHGGFTEKDLVLDVSLRLGRMLQDKMGADVVYTRDDDTFVPLESRTAVANQNQADLFLSIHANSSRDSGARGVETYYLNFTSSEDALEVAARENAVSEKSIHELQDLVKKIALKDKIEESREFASDVQTALHAGISKKNPGVRNRGVKKAPFVVLIGANMPSILAEISFLSNDTDERKLKTPEYRQRIAEAIYKGVAKYVDGLSGISLASGSKSARNANQ